MVEATVKSYESIPVPPGLPVVGNTLDFAKSNRLEWLQEQVDDLGDIFRFKIVREPLIYIANADYVQQVLARHNKYYGKQTRSFDRVRAFLGNGLVTNDGEPWKVQRKLMQPAFHKSRIAALVQTMTSVINELNEEWEQAAEKGEMINLIPEMMKLTLDIMTKTLFSSSLEEHDIAEVRETIDLIFKETSRRILFPFWITDKMPLPNSLNYERNIKRFDKVIYKLIEQRKGKEDQYQDLLSLLMNSRYEDGSAMEPEQLRDELATMFLAGHETTSTALTWLWLLLAQNPGEQEKLHEEVDAVLGDRMPTMEDYPRLERCLMAFKESMRIHPPISLLIRAAIEPDVIGDYQIPAGSRVVVSPYSMHHDPRYWQHPDRFYPEHFTKENEQNRHPYAYIPFGGGPRVCLGNYFAYVEGVLAIAMIMQRFHVTILKPEEAKSEFSLTLRVKDPLMARIERR